MTLPNVLLNFDRAKIPTRCEFYSGDWASLATLFDDESRKYDYVFTCETIYNPNNHQKLYEVLKAGVKIGGIVYVCCRANFSFSHEPSQKRIIFLLDSSLEKAITLAWAVE
jgi:hypothetical protein